MKKITREEVEELFEISEVLDKKIEQTRDEICLSFSLSNSLFIKVIYTTSDHQTSYFVNQLL